MKCAVSISVNGRQCDQEIEPRLLLVHFLRDAGCDRRQIGCDTSQCGACTVLMDGVAVKSCTTLAVQADGARVTTIEGLAENGELTPLQDAFWAKHGLQCGFCTPGMVFAAHEILRTNPNPSPEQIRHGLEGNMCRCTATRTSSALCRPRLPIRGARGSGWAMTTVNAAPARVFGSGPEARGPAALTGTARYTADFTLPGMVHAAILRSPHGHARIRRIDTSRAKGAPGVVAVFTGADTESALKAIPCAWLLPNSGLNVAPYRAIASDVVRYVGDAVAVVVAASDAQAADALDLIEVDYEPLPAVVNPQKAAAEGAPQLHQEAPGNVAFHWTVAGGDVDAAFNSAPVVLRDRIIQQRLIPTAIESRAARSRSLRRPPVS